MLMSNPNTSGTFYGVLVMLLATAAVGANAWELVHETSEMRVERRDYQGSELDEIKGAVRIKATLNAAMALLKMRSLIVIGFTAAGARVFWKTPATPRHMSMALWTRPFPCSTGIRSCASIISKTR